MNKKRWWIQSVPYAAMIVLLLSSYLIDRWHESLERSFRATFDDTAMWSRIWSIPLLLLLYAILGLLLFRYLTTHNNRNASILFLCVGLFVVFYPPIGLFFGIIGKLGIPVGYFPDSIFYFIGAMIAGIGLLNLILPINSEDIGN